MKIEKDSQSLYFDILIKGGMVYDGTLAEPRVADVGISGDRIDDIGILNRKASKTIDARGLIVTPGFIDVHTHTDDSFKKIGKKKDIRDIASLKGNWNYLYQGVSTIITGNCGLGDSNVDDWLSTVDGIGFGSNVYHLIPHGELRLEIFKNKQPGELNQRQIDLLRAKVAEAMEMGAIGMSTGLELSPGFLSKTQEIIELSKVVRKYGGVYASHIRNETGRDVGHGKIGILEALREAIEIGKRAEIPVEISHLKVAAPINNISAQQVLDIIEDGRKQGIDITADQYPYEAGSTYLTYLIPHEFVENNRIKRKYRSKKGLGEIGKAIENVFSYLGPEGILISMFGGNEDYEGKTLKEISEIRGEKPSVSFVDLVCYEEPPKGIFFGQDINIIQEIMRHDCILTGSDGRTVEKGISKPHPRFYGTFPKKIKEFVLNRNILSLKAAIRSMTSLPAEKFNLRGRGRIENGYYADVAVIDLSRIRDCATYLDPHEYSLGIEYLIVNGILSIDRGNVTGDRGGRGIRRS